MCIHLSWWSNPEHRNVSGQHSSFGVKYYLCFSRMFPCVCRDIIFIFFHYNQSNTRINDFPSREQTFLMLSLCFDYFLSSLLHKHNLVSTKTIISIDTFQRMLIGSRCFGHNWGIWWGLHTNDLFWKNYPQYTNRRNMYCDVSKLLWAQQFYCASCWWAKMKQIKYYL